MSLQVFKYNEAFVLESGKVLPSFHLGYHTFGSLNETKDNVVWVFHALTANSNPAEWWDGLVGAGKCFDPENYFIVCVNMPGSCYGSIHPLDKDAETGFSYYHNFPNFTTRDMIRAYAKLCTHLQINRIHIGIGGSMGGQQLLEWAIESPSLFEYIIPIATNAVHSAWGRAFNASQRMAIEADSTWQQNTKKAGLKGLAVARSIALLSYRHYDGYNATQKDKVDNQLNKYKAESYQRYQGKKLVDRFDAFSYYNLTLSMDAHNVGRGRGGVENALAQIKAKTLVIGVNSDVLFPITEQKFLADSISFAQFAAIDSLYGHDGFLLEFETIENIINGFLKRKFKYA